MKMHHYSGERLSHVAFPMGGIGAGMVSLGGTGALCQCSLRHAPEVMNEPWMFGALYVKGTPTARVVEGPVPRRKIMGLPESGGGLGAYSFGLPRFKAAAFEARFPFATVTLTDPEMPVAVSMTGWSPFIPGNADDSSLPVAAVEYTFSNRSAKAQEAVFSYHAVNVMKTESAWRRVTRFRGGIVLRADGTAEHPEWEGALAIFTDDVTAKVDASWFRGGWHDGRTMVWNQVVAGKVVDRDPRYGGGNNEGGSLYVPLSLKAGEVKTIRICLAWYVPNSRLEVGTKCCCEGACCESPFYQPWYSGKYKDVEHVVRDWRRRYAVLREKTEKFTRCFYDTSMPPEFTESVAGTLSILKSPTVLRQRDGRLWGWEGCNDRSGCCHGSCTHVWNYAQAVAHLFPSLERSLRETEFLVSQDTGGHQNFRSALPIQATDHGFHAAADGQLGGIMKLYREWRISADTPWMKRLWPAARRSLDFCIGLWDPDHTGTLVEPHHNTYDIEFWGADGMCTSFYLGALSAAVAMGTALGEEVSLYTELLKRGRTAMESVLWNGRWFVQRVQTKGLRSAPPGKEKSWNVSYSPEALTILGKEGPKYQYGEGCLADGVLGDWMARCCALPPVVNPAQVARHVASVFRHNFKASLRNHSNPQRSGYAFADDGGVLLCSWPEGGKPSLPFVYCDEVFTGIEYHVAAHLIMTGQLAPARKIIRAVRKRYDGQWRNPFDEYECGHWYARAMSSYSLLQAYGGARFEPLEKTLYLTPSTRGDFRVFLSTATGYGTVGIRNGKPFANAVSGTFDIRTITVKKKSML